MSEGPKRPFANIDYAKQKPEPFKPQRMKQYRMAGMKDGNVDLADLVKRLDELNARRDNSTASDQDPNRDSTVRRDLENKIAAEYHKIRTKNSSEKR